MKRLLLVLLLSLTPLLPAVAEVATFQTLPSVRNNPSNDSTTVAVTNTFQAVWAANSGRVDCIIQNTGTNAQYVFQGAAADATIAKSIKLVAGQAFYCAFNGITYQGAIAITGTSTETFYASQV